MGRAKGTYAWLKEISKLGDHLSEAPKSEIRLPEHVEAGLTDLEQCEDVAAFISKISREYSPLSVENLPDRVVNGLVNCPCSGHPALEDYKIYEIMKNRKLTSGVEGDIHPDIMRDCMTELAHPVGVILRDAVETHTWPLCWKMEHQLVIPKVPVPKTKNDLRNLGLSPFFSKCLEWVLVCWLWPVLSQFLTGDQYGGKAGCSTNHYLARFINYI